MNRRLNIYLGIIAILVILGIWINLPNSKLNIGSFERSFPTQLGLDLRGGLQVLLEADLPETTEVTADQLDVARSILENRSNALGVSEVTFTTAGTRRLVGEFPGATNVEEVLATIKQTGLLEFVELGQYMEPGTPVKTDYGLSSPVSPTVVPPAGLTPTVETTPAEAGATPQAQATPSATPEETIYHTVFTGSILKTVGVTQDSLGNYQVAFELTPEGSTLFGTYSSDHVGDILGIVLDKTVISAPSINSAITQGTGEITGRFTAEEANNLAIQLRYGSLPIPLKVVESRVIYPTLGTDPLQKSLIAAIVGLFILFCSCCCTTAYPAV